MNFRLLGLATFLSAALATAAPAAAFAPQDRSPFAPWIDGVAEQEPVTQTQRYDRDTYVIRQSVRTNYEAPFLYLLFGRDRALLLDSGAGGVSMRPAVDAVIARWLAETGRKSIPLVVAHTHGHGDHHQGDAEFRARPDTTVVGLAPDEVAAFFGVKTWPTQIVTYDLGGRVLDVIPAPGHQPAHIIVYDRRTHLLLTGDTLYPGRLYVPVNRFADFRASLDRVAAFLAGKPVAWALGAHIEMTKTAGRELPGGARTHPDEHALELPYSAFQALKAAVDGMGDRVQRHVHADFVVVPSPAR